MQQLPHTVLGADSLQLPRVHVDDPQAARILSRALVQYTQAKSSPEFPDSMVAVCIGTDRSTGDALGPLVGTQLEEMATKGFQVYGTLDDPVHATNLPERLMYIAQRHPRSLIIAVDACLGRSESIGYISLKEGPLKPGTGVNKKLPAVGHLHMIGVVNVGGFMEYLVLQNTRLSLVMRMARVVASALSEAGSHIASLLPTVPNNDERQTLSLPGY